MSRFRFALQPLLDVRRREEDERRDELAGAARRATSESRRAALSRDAFSHEARRFSGAALSLAPQTVRDALERLALLEAAVRSAESAARRSTACADSARSTYAAARLERRRIEALRDRALAAFEREAERCENLALEEANARTHTPVTLLASSFNN